MFLNEFLGSEGEIKCIYGPSATGKTTLAILASIDKAKEGKKVFFLDVENSFSLERLKQIVGEGYEKVLENIFVFKVKNFREQQSKIKEICGLCKKANVRLVVIDTLNYYYRTLVNSKADLANNMLASQLKLLKELSESGVSVLIINQVYANFRQNKVDPVGSKLIKKFSDCLIELEKDPKRKIKLLVPEKKESFFKILDSGIVYDP